MMPQIILERYGQNAHSDYKTDSPTQRTELRLPRGRVGVWGQQMPTITQRTDKQHSPTA